MNTLKIGDEVCISTQALYEQFGDTLAYCKILVDKEGNNTYYDMYNSHRNVCCMDGEVCRVESVNNQCVSFINEQYCAAQFNLSSAEVDVAIFKAFGKENNNPAKKEKTDIER